MPHTRTTTQSSITPRALHEAESAKYIGMSRAFLRAARLGRCDGPPYIRAGRAVRYLISDLDPARIARRYNWWAVFHLAVFFGSAAATAWFGLLGAFRM